MAHHIVHPRSPGEWVEAAACARPGAPDMSLHVGASVASIEARRCVCLRCPVLDQCRSWALTVPDPAFEHMAGGLTPAERSQTRRWGLR